MAFIYNEPIITSSSSSDEKLYPHYLNTSGNIIYNGHNDISKNIEQHCLNELIKIVEESLFNKEYSQKPIIGSSNNSIQFTKQQINNAILKFRNYNYDSTETLSKLSDFLKVNLNYHKKIIKENSMFLSSTLDQEYILWNDVIHRILIDFLVQFVGLDKIETQKRKTITTTKRDKYSTYFNYYLMEYEILEQPKIYYNEDTENFYYAIQANYLLPSENELKEEIETIKKLVPLSERKNYFK